MIYEYLFISIILRSSIFYRPQFENSLISLDTQFCYLHLYTVYTSTPNYLMQNRVFFLPRLREPRAETAPEEGLNDSGEAATGPKCAVVYIYLLCLKCSGHVMMVGAKFLKAPN